MQKSISRVLTLLLASVMLLCCVPMAASADGEAYAVLGVQNGDRIILNPQIGGYTDFQHKVTIVDKDQVSTNMSQYGHLTDQVNFTLDPQATGIDSVVFAIDGVTVVTDDEAPYEFALGAEYAGSHTLIATINKTEGGTEVKTIAFTGVYGELSDYRLVNYNSGVLDASNTPTFNGVVSRGETIENGVLKLSQGQTINAIWLQPDVQKKEMQLGDTKLFYVDYDVMRTHKDVQIQLRTSRDYRVYNYATGDYLLDGFPVNEWVHVTIVADYERGWFSAYLDGVQFKSWSQPNMLASDSNSVTDSIASEHNLSSGHLYIDNYAVRTYETAQERSYSLVEVKGDVPMNLTTVPVVSKTVGINDTRGVSKVEYFVDGELAATVDALPFTYDVPITKINSDFTVSAKVYAQTVTECAPITFKAIYLKEIGNRFDETFEGKTGAVAASDNVPNTSPRGGAYSYTYVDATSEGLGRTGTVVKYDRDESNTTADALKSGLLGTKAVGVSDAGGPNAWVKFQLDFYLPADKTYTSADKIFISDYAPYQDAVVCDLSKMEKGKWHTLVAYLDAPNREVIGNIGDNTTVTQFTKNGENGATTGMTLAATTALSIYVKSLSDLYVDNVFVDRVGVNDAVSGAFLNGISYDKDYDSVDATVSYCNMTNDPVDVNVYFALYKGNTLVKGWAEPVTVAANEFKLISKDVTFAQINGTGTTVKAFCWTPDLQPINVQRECN